MTRWLLLTLILVGCRSADPPRTAPETASPGERAPIAAGTSRFLGNVYAPSQVQDFAHYWNQVVPENAGKWGSVEAIRDQMDWSGLDEAYALARRQGFPFRLHVLIWGNQQPAWIEDLPTEVQRAELAAWFAAVAARYPDIEFVEVVNEPLHDPPDRSGEGGGNYLDALGGRGTTGYDWVITAFTWARQHFPEATLMLNEYGILDNPERARTYRDVVTLLHERALIDAIGIQGHAFSLDAPTATIQENLDLLAGTGLPLYITELDVDGPTDAEQLGTYQRVFPVLWEHPAVRGITLWGWRPGMWRTDEQAFLVRPDGRSRPALRWLREYVATSE